MTGLKNHYVPIFYLNQWLSGADERICEFTRPRDALMVQRKSPVQTGFQRGLYTMGEGGTKTKGYLEEVFLQGVDSNAATALRLLADEKIDEVRQRNLTTSWSRFLISMMNRNPERVSWAKVELRRHWETNRDYLKTEYDKMREPDAPDFDTYKTGEGRKYEARTVVRFLQMIMDLQQVGQALNNMEWAVFGKLGGLPETLLTCDRPVFMPIGLGYPRATIIFPLGPTKLFVAAKTREVFEHLESLGPRGLVAHVNNAMCRRAAKLVFGRDEGMHRFVDQRLGRDSDARHLATFFKNR